MNKDKTIKLLKDYNPEHVENFAAYCVRLEKAKKKDGSLQNPWMQYKSEEDMATLFKRVAKDGLVFDGVHITLQSTGISYDYIAYKNKMFLAYPESTVDVGLVYEGDTFNFKKESGKVKYQHEIANPFNQVDSNIQGGYCVIKNKRGEFITLLSKPDIDKHRRVAKTDYIWQNWFAEMAMKTVIKKACKLHFSDIYQDIETTDNENYDTELVNVEVEDKEAINAIKTIEELKDCYIKNKGKGAEYDRLIKERKEELTAENIKQESNENS